MTSFDEAVQVAITVTPNERNLLTLEVFSAKRDGVPQAIVCYNYRKRDHYARLYIYGEGEIFRGQWSLQACGGWPVARSNRARGEEFLHAKGVQGEIHPMFLVQFVR